MKVQNRHGEVFETDIFSIVINKTSFEIRENFDKDGFHIRKTSYDETDTLTINPISSNNVNLK